ncbi:MAG: hypothetical protein HRU19_21600 [Pseudobacteriovorax sp.]|nr:hypothetical protein [Pseudobacteriovorax sp.]
MSDNKSYDELAVLKEIIQADQHLLDRVVDRIRALRQTSGQSLNDYMKDKRSEENDIIQLRKRQQKQDFK